MDSDAAHWRKLAEQARLAAADMTWPEAKTVMLEIAAAYLRLVDRANTEPQGLSELPESNSEPEKDI
jgi:hypothetical protein